MIGTAEVFLVGVVPALVAAVLMYAAGAMSVRPAAAWAVSICVAVVAGQLGLAAHDQIPFGAESFGEQVQSWLSGVPTAVARHAMPKIAHEWLPISLGLAALLAIVVAYGRRVVAVAALALTALLVAVAPALLLWQSVYVHTEWSTAQATRWLAALAALFVIVWTLLQVPKANPQPLVRASLFALVTLGTAAVLTMSGSFTYGHLCLPLDAALFAATSVAILLDRKSASELKYLDGLDGAASVITLALGSLIMMGYFYASLTAANGLLLCVALVLAGGWLPLGRRVGDRWQAVTRIVACLVPLTTAVTLAAFAFREALVQ